MNIVTDVFDELFAAFQSHPESQSPDSTNRHDYDSYFYGTSSVKLGLRSQQAEFTDNSGNLLAVWTPA